jgi:hypothetical protein
VDVGVNDTFYKAGWYNPLVSGQLAWDLGYGWGFSYLLGSYIDVNSPTAWSSTSLNQRFALSYTGYGWNLTANAIWGIQFNQVTSNPQLSGCPVSPAFPNNGCNPNFINVDLTVHLHRMPETEWVCLDSVTLPEANGIGIADTRLFDERGAIGRAVQTLLVAGRR